MTRSGGALIKLKNIVPTLYLSAYSTRYGIVKKRRQREQEMSEIMMKEEKEQRYENAEEDTEEIPFFTINSTRVNCQREGRAR